MILPLSSVLVRPYLEWCVHFWAPQYKRDMDALGRFQQKTNKVMKDPEHGFYEKKVRQLGLFSMGGKKKAQGSLIYIYKHTKEGCKEDRSQLFLKMSCDRTGGNGHRLKQFILSEHLRTLFYWTLPQIGVSFRNIETLSRHRLGQYAVGDLAWAARLDKMISRGSFWLQLYHPSMIPRNTKF